MEKQKETKFISTPHFPFITKKEISSFNKVLKGKFSFNDLEEFLSISFDILAPRVADDIIVPLLSLFDIDPQDVKKADEDISFSEELDDVYCDIVDAIYLMTKGIDHLNIAKNFKAGRAKLNAEFFVLALRGFIKEYLEQLSCLFSQKYEKENTIYDYNLNITKIENITIGDVYSIIENTKSYLKRGGKFLEPENIFQEIGQGFEYVIFEDEKEMDRDKKDNSNYLIDSASDSFFVLRETLKKYKTKPEYLLLSLSVIVYNYWVMSLFVLLLKENNILLFCDGGDIDDHNRTINFSSQKEMKEFIKNTLGKDREEIFAIIKEAGKKKKDE